MRIQEFDQKTISKEYTYQNESTASTDIFTPSSDCSTKYCSIDKKSKAIKKEEKPLTKVLTKEIISESSKKVLFIHSNRHSKLSSHNTSRMLKFEPKEAFVNRSYLKGTKLEKTLGSIRAKQVSLAKRVAPVDSDFPYSKNSFTDQLKKQNFYNPSGFVLVKAPPSFQEPNDISNISFNPVIERIQRFMDKKEQLKNPDKTSFASSNKISFLNIRNIWTSPSAASQILERGSRTENLNSSTASISARSQRTLEEQSTQTQQDTRYNQNTYDTTSVNGDSSVDLETLQNQNSRSNTISFGESYTNSIVAQQNTGEGAFGVSALPPSTTQAWGSGSTC